jgi:hypothetical protein
MGFEQRLNEELRDLHLVGMTRVAIDPTGIDEDGHIISWPFSAEIYKISDGAYWLSSEALGDVYIYKDKMIFGPKSPAWNLIIARYNAVWDAEESEGYLSLSEQQRLKQMPAEEVDAIVNAFEDSIVIHKDDDGDWIEVEQL